ncbi:glycosyltransferase family 1 protein [Verrucomicrobia bacterium S94]|nr:glycosyltransferase family 1 protein [Verrucomicrobia bacterium S94]
MRILMVHNYYQQRGGEDVSMESEVALLKEHGHSVELYSMHNDSIGRIGRFRIAFRTIWSVTSYREIKRIISEQQIEVMHVQNFFPLISPSVYFAAKKCGVPVVQSVRNYRLFCLNAFFHREGKICELCFNKTFAWPGIKYACYRDSKLASFVVASMQFTHHHILRSFSKKVDYFIALSAFVKTKLLEAGIPQERIIVKPNFVNPDPGRGDADKKRFVFVGRLSPEKGVNTLLEAWETLSAQGQLQGYELVIIGDGPDRQALEMKVDLKSIKFMGRLDAEETLNIIGESKCLIFPSEWYETFGRVAIEAYGKGVPVIASRIGAIEELIQDGKTGLLFEAGNVQSLGEKLVFALENPREMEAMGRAARLLFEAKYSAGANYHQLVGIYKKAMRRPDERQVYRGTID